MNSYPCIITGTVNFNSFHGCLKCTAVGTRSKEQRVNVYPVTEAPKRTDEGFRKRLYGDHHQTYKIRDNGKLKTICVESPLLRLPIDMVEDIIVSDSLHLLHLGITKKLLTIYKEGRKMVKIYHRQY